MPITVRQVFHRVDQLTTVAIRDACRIASRARCGETQEMSAGDEPEFPDDFDRVLPDESGDVAYFGRDVLRGLVHGIRLELEHQRAHASRWHWGTAVLGCAMWMDDPVLMHTLRECSSVCVVVTKQARTGRWEKKFEHLQRFAQEAQGLAQQAFPELAELAPNQGGAPLVIGPGAPLWDEVIPPIRELGFRRVGDRLVPIVHAKLALIGQMRWTDEHPSGHPVDETYFVPARLWVGSANFTSSSRRSLEMGMWTSRPPLIAAARRFLLGLIGASEPLGTSHPRMTPEFLPVEYDDEAFFEYVRDLGTEADLDDDEQS
jgi:hypothetical protein